MAYIDAITDLEKKLFSFDPQAEKVYNLINDLKTFIPIKEIPAESNIPKTKIIKLVFDRNSAATEQVLFALKYLGKVSKAAEIAATIKEFDPTFDKGLSTPFNKLKEAESIAIFNPTITALNPEGSNHQVYYGLKDWFLAKNKVKEEYLGEDLKYLA